MSETNTEPPHEVFVLIDRFGLIVTTNRGRENAERLANGPYADLGARVVVYRRSPPQQPAASTREAYVWGFMDGRGDGDMVAAEAAWEANKPHLTGDPSVVRLGLIHERQQPAAKGDGITDDTEAIRKGAPVHRGPAASEPKRLLDEVDDFIRDDDTFARRAASEEAIEGLPATNAVARLLWRHILDDMAHPTLLASYDPSDPRRYESLSESDKALLRRRADEILALTKSAPQEKGP